MYIDADACPVKEEIIRLSEDKNISLHFVASYDHKTTMEYENVKWSYVDPGPDSTDFFIFKHIQKNDLLITQDIGLASLALNKGALALSPRGRRFTQYSIETALEFRYLSRKARESGIYEKGPKAFSKDDRHLFRQEYIKILSNYVGISK